jgi:ABC-type uncharacterized transport system auxiliary subunit
MPGFVVATMSGLVGLYMRMAVTCLRGWVLLGAMSMVLAGCALQSSVQMQPLALHYEPPSRRSASAFPDTVMVYQFLLAASVNPQYVMVSELGSAGPPRVVQRWQENPAVMITNLTLRDVAQSGLFAGTVDQFSNAGYRYALDGTVRAIEGRVTDGKAAVVLTVEVSLIDFEGKRPGDKTPFTKVYHVETPCKDSSSGAIAEGLNTAVAEYSRRLRQDIASFARKSG